MMNILSYEVSTGRGQGQYYETVHVTNTLPPTGLRDERA
jgi:hypothetical protein